MTHIGIVNRWYFSDIASTARRLGVMTNLLSGALDSGMLVSSTMYCNVRERENKK